MSKLTITTFLSLDGVMQAPGAPKEDPSGNFGHGGWMFPHVDADFGRFMTEVFAKADAFLLGRRTYEIFAAHWPRVTDPADPIAGTLNKLPKYVASKTLEKAEWSGTTVIRDVVSEVAKLKQLYSRDVQVHGSATRRSMVGSGYSCVSRSRRRSGRVRQEENRRNGTE
jgi:dihydrofolate reductase